MKKEKYLFNYDYLNKEIKDYLRIKMLKWLCMMSPYSITIIQ